MLQLNVGIRLASFGLPFRPALARAAALGAEAVELDTQGEIQPAQLSPSAIREIRKLLEDHRLRVCAVRCQTRLGYEVADQLDRRIEATKQAMTMAYKLGASVVTNYVGQIPESAEDSRWGALVDVLADLGRHGQRAGATLSARTGAERGELLARLIQALPAGSLGVDFDPAALIFHGHSPREALTVLAPYVLHVRARDAVCEIAQGRGVALPLGQGAADFPTLLGLLEQHQYRGYLTVEWEPSREAELQIRAAVIQLRSLFA